jgi:hypothetical protein
MLTNVVVATEHCCTAETVSEIPWELAGQFSKSSQTHVQHEVQAGVCLKGNVQSGLCCTDLYVPVLLQVGKKYDMQLLLHKVDLYLESRAAEMKWPTPHAVCWMWFKRADVAGLTVCLPVIAKRIMQAGYKSTCAVDENLEGLSVAACKVLLKAVVSAGKSPSDLQKVL